MILSKSSPMPGGGVASAQRGGRMERAHERRAVAQVELALAELRDAERAAGEQLRREVAEGDDDLGLDQLELARRGTACTPRPRPAADRGCPGGRQPGRSRSRRPLRCRPSFCSMSLVEQLPGGADERLALLVLVEAGRLADEHQVGVRVADAEHGLRADVAERARATRLGLLRELRQRGRGRPASSWWPLPRPPRCQLGTTRFSPRDRGTPPRPFAARTPRRRASCDDLRGERADERRLAPRPLPSHRRTRRRRRRTCAPDGTIA